MGDVKNVTAHDRQLLGAIIDSDRGLRRSASGRSTHSFAPDSAQNFNRSATDDFVNGRQQQIGAFDSPKHAGIPLGEVLRVGPDHFDVLITAEAGALHNGDDLAGWDLQGELNGVPINVAKPLDAGDPLRWRLWPNLPRVG